MRRLLLLVPFLLADPALAQGTGTLAGRVTDAASGEGLPGANVVIEGTQLGARADIDGNYRIIGVPVGTYRVAASFVGFDDGAAGGVKVRSGWTTQQDFKLATDFDAPFVIIRYGPSINSDPFAPRILLGEEILRLPVSR